MFNPSFAEIASYGDRPRAPFEVAHVQHQRPVVQLDDLRFASHFDRAVPRFPTFAAVAAPNERREPNAVLVDKLRRENELAAARRDSAAGPLEQNAPIFTFRRDVRYIDRLAPRRAVVVAIRQNETPGRPHFQPRLRRVNRLAVMRPKRGDPNAAGFRVDENRRVADALFRRVGPVVIDNDLHRLPSFAAVETPRTRDVDVRRKVSRVVPTSIVNRDQRSV